MNLQQLQLEFRDFAQYSPGVRAVLSRIQRWRARSPGVSDPQGLARSIRGLTSAARLTMSEPYLRTIEAELSRRVAALDTDRIDWSEFIPNLSPPRLTKSVILKPYLGPTEKGVVFISFPYNWVRLLTLSKVKEFASRYSLVVAPSWSRPHDLISYVFPKAWPDPIHTLISNQKDLDYFPRISSKYRPVPLYASSWVDPDLFHPTPRASREFDLVMVANFGRFKRHFAFFRALSTMRKSLKVLLIGQDQDGRTDQTVREEAKAYGVQDRFELQRDAPHQDVVDALCRSRVSLVLSRREGSCVVIAESLFADTPAALLADAEIGSRAFINDHTGRLLEHRDLGRQLESFIDHADAFEPRRWAMANISCTRSHDRLNQAVKASLMEDGQTWTRDLAEFCWRPDPVLLHAEDQKMMDAERRAIIERFGVAIGDEFSSGADAAR